MATTTKTKKKAKKVARKGPVKKTPVARKGKKKKAPARAAKETTTSSRPGKAPQEISAKQQQILDRIVKAQEKAKEADERLREQVAKAREEEITWQNIADTLGVAQGTAYRRYANNDGS